MEKSKIEYTDFTKREDEYFWLLVAAGVLLLTEAFARLTIFKTIP